jgi:hypothetical protein
MTAYALVLNGNVLWVREFDTGNENVPSLSASKGQWLPVTHVVDTFDSITQRQGSPVTTITNTDVTIHSPARSLTTDELNALIASKISNRNIRTNYTQH